MKSVLIVEHDDGVAEALAQTLAVHGYAPQRTDSGLAALGLLDGVRLVLLGLTLPDLAGHEVCRRIREQSCVPVIALSEPTDELDELDRVMALHMGADDVVAKPFGRFELMARVQAVLRRAGSCPWHERAAADARGAESGPGPSAHPATSVASSDMEAVPVPAQRTASGDTATPVGAAGAATPVGATGAAGAVAWAGTARPQAQAAAVGTVAAVNADAGLNGSGCLSAGPLLLDPRIRKVFLHGAEVRITRKEFDLLAMLIQEPGTVMKRQEIMARVWDENWFGSTRTLDVHVGSLRGKLGSAEWIETVRGVGYRLTVPVTQGR
ncbi:response regulator transcription factor [Streptomyces sp. NBC_00289]|uniref:response regulator transcription factor n=1 Tax=Streptomyces sp. NBC_00289 TaxID=2975703 RepID=UPI003243C2C3